MVAAQLAPALGQMQSDVQPFAERRALRVVHNWLFSSELIKQYEEDKSWPPSEYVTTYLTRAWEALEAAVVNTRLVALLHCKEHSELRKGVGEMVHRMVKMRENAPGGRDVRVWQISDWQDSVLLTQELPTGEEVLERLKRSEKVIEGLVRTRVIQTTAGPGLTIRPLVARELEFQSNIGASSPAILRFFQEVGAERAAEELYDYDDRFRSECAKNVALSAIRDLLTSLALE